MSGKAVRETVGFLAVVFVVLTLARRLRIASALGVPHGRGSTVVFSTEDTDPAYRTV